MSGLAMTCKTRGGQEIVRALTTLQNETKKPPVDMLNVLGVAAVREVQRGIRNQVSPSGAPYPAVLRFGARGKRLVDTNRLVNSITYEVRGNSLAVGTNVIYAARQHFGGIVTPKTSKLLAIPMTRTIARAYRAGVSLREQYPTAFIFRSISQGLYLVRKREGATRGSKNQLEFLFHLVPRANVPATFFMGIGRGGELVINDLLNKRFGVIVSIRGVGQVAA